MRIFCPLLISLSAGGTISHYEATEHPCQTEGETQNGYTCFAMFETGKLVWYKHVHGPAQNQGGCPPGVYCNTTKNQVVDCNKFYCGNNPQCSTAAPEYYNCCCGGHNSITKIPRDSHTSQNHIVNKVYLDSIHGGHVAPPRATPPSSPFDYGRHVPQPVQYKIGNAIHSPPANRPTSVQGPQQVQNPIQYTNRVNQPQQIIHPSHSQQSIHPSQTQYVNRVQPPQVSPPAQYVNRPTTSQVYAPAQYVNRPPTSQVNAPVQYINRPNQGTVSTPQSNSMSLSSNSVHFAPPGQGLQPARMTNGPKPVQVVQPNNHYTTQVVQPAAQKAKKKDDTKYTIRHTQSKRGNSFTLTLNGKNHE